MGLNSDLSLLSEKVLSSMPEDIRNKLIDEDKKLFSRFLESKALKKGDSFPDVSFLDKNLKQISLKEMLKENHLVISFYRGTWCPYCNLELKALAKIDKEIEAKGARLIAVSPELYKFSEDTVKKNNINYLVLTDLANKAADKFGLVFELPPQYCEIYKILNINLNEINGNSRWILPIPATFIISKEGVIASTYVNVNYMNRMEPDEILKQLDLLNV